MLPRLHGQKPFQENVSCRHYFEGQREHSGNRRILFALRIHVLVHCHNISKTLDNCLPVTWLTPRCMGPGRWHQWSSALIQLVDLVTGYSHTVEESHSNQSCTLLWWHSKVTSPVFITECSCQNFGETPLQELLSACVIDTHWYVWEVNVRNYRMSGLTQPQAFIMQNSLNTFHWGEVSFITSYKPWHKSMHIDSYQEINDIL